MDTASEFHLFELDKNVYPTVMPHDHGEYFDIAPFDKEDILRGQEK